MTATNNYISHAQAGQKYRELRETVHRAAVMELRRADGSKFSHLTITDITSRALEALQIQWNHAARRVDWDWAEEVVHWRNRRPSCWEMAIWHKQTLCGLVLGGPSRRRSRLYVEGIEGSPEANHFKTQVIPIALLASERYAVSIKSQEVWLVSPPDALIDSYEKVGYNVKLPNPLLAKVLRLKRFAVKTVGV